jgi:NAD(P)H-dependent flavin oxidoreductase YrpB (nitropropane dioxygenase family)
MRTELCKRLGIEVPIFAFTHCRDVVVEVSRAGGLGVLGAAGFRPEQLERELHWIDDHVDGKPYGVDVIMPIEFVDADPKALAGMIPEGHKQWLESVMKRYNVPPLPDDYDDARYISAEEVSWRPEQSRALLDVAFSHPIKMIVNALGVPPKDVIDLAHEHGVLIGGLCGKAKHAIRQKEAGVDFVIAQGHEAGGHTGEIASMVLTPEVVRARSPRRWPWVRKAPGAGRFGSPQRRATWIRCPNASSSRPRRPIRCALECSVESPRGCCEASSPTRGKSRIAQASCRCRFRACSFTTRAFG